LLAFFIFCFWRLAFNPYRIALYLHKNRIGQVNGIAQVIIAVLRPYCFDRDVNGFVAGRKSNEKQDEKQGDTLTVIL
jgi:hypothetical protein